MFQLDYPKFEEDMNRLKEIEVELRTYCHASGCKRIFECPGSCDCNRSLNLATSVAWQAANIIKNIDLADLTGFDIAYGSIRSLGLAVQRHVGTYEELRPVIEAFLIIERMLMHFDRMNFMSTKLRQIECLSQEDPIIHQYYELYRSWNITAEDMLIGIILNQSAHIKNLEKEILLYVSREPLGFRFVDMPDEKIKELTEKIK